MLKWLYHIVSYTDIVGHQFWHFWLVCGGRISGFLVDFVTTLAMLLCQCVWCDLSHRTVLLCALSEGWTTNVLCIHWVWTKIRRPRNERLRLTPATCRVASLSTPTIRWAQTDWDGLCQTVLLRNELVALLTLHLLDSWPTSRTLCLLHSLPIRSP